MIDRNSRPAITAISRRDPRATPPPSWAPGHPPGHPDMESSGHKWVCHPAGPASDSQHVPHNGTLHGTRKSNAVPAGDRGAHPTQGQGWDGGSPGTRPASLSVCVVASRRRHSLICRGLWPCDSAAFLLWGQRNLGLTKERAWGDSGGLLWGSAKPVKASGQGVSCTRGTFGAGMWGRMCVLLCCLKTVPSPRDRHARGHGIGPRSLTVPPFLHASGEAEQHRRDRRTRTHPGSAGSLSTR